MNPIHLLVVADDPLVRAGLVILLSELPDCEVSGQSGSEVMVDQAANQLFLPAPDAIVWDLGWETTDLEQEWVENGVPIVALLADELQVVEAWNAGIKAMLRRDSTPERIADAARAACLGLIVLDPELTRSLLPSMNLAGTSLIEALTPRESEVLQLLAEGVTNKAIAQRLEISEHTVKFHVNAILSKLESQSRTEAVVKATRLGLISL
jgi:two-component system nitrate/nitrite response regulator NarL